jgi:circadian clock protein KaiB
MKSACAPAPSSRRVGAALRERWDLRLYIAGQTPCSLVAIANLRKICDEYLPGRCRIQIVDLLVHPKLARDHEILAIPTLVRKRPKPLRRIVGNCSNIPRALAGLQLQAGGCQ